MTSFIKTVSYATSEVAKLDKRLNARIDGDLKALLEAAGLEVASVAKACMHANSAFSAMPEGKAKEFLEARMSDVKEACHLAYGKNKPSGAEVSKFCAPWRQNIANALYRLTGLPSIHDQRKAAAKAKETAQVTSANKGGQRPSKTNEPAPSEHAEGKQVTHRAIDAAMAALTRDVFKQLMERAGGFKTAGDREKAAKALAWLEQNAA